MNKFIRKYAVCMALTATVVTGWGAGTRSGVAGGKQSSSKTMQKAAGPSVVKKSVPAPATSKATKSVEKPGLQRGGKTPPLQKKTRAEVPASALKRVGGTADGADRAIKYSADENRLVSCDTNAIAVKVKKTVKLIHGNAFRGCASLLRVQFLGDAPNAADEVFADLPRGCTIYVEKGSKGWPSGIPCVWKGMRVRYSNEIKNSPMTLAGQIKLDGIEYRVRPCGDGIALSANPESLSAAAVGTFSIPEKIGNAPVRLLDDSVFPSCTNVEKVVIPASVTNVALAAFSRCGRPRRIEIGAGNPVYKMVDGVVYEMNSKTVILAGTEVSAVKVPADALGIGPEAFKGCESLTTVELPTTLKTIGKGAFAGCMGLSVVTVPIDADVASNAFEGCCATVRKVRTYRHYDGFAGKCSEVRWIPEGVILEGPFSDNILPLRMAVERAGKGDGFALYSLAIHCAKGDEAKCDPVRAIDYLKKAVSEKDAAAEFLLGLILESRMAGSDLNDAKAPGIAGRLGKSNSKAGTPFEKYVGVPSAAFADSKKAAKLSEGSLADEKDYKLLRDVYEAASQGGCRAAGIRLEHLSYLSMRECERVEKVANQRLLDGLQHKQ